MTNHFHLLVDIPDREELEPLTEEELLALASSLHGGVTVTGVKQELEPARLAGDGAWHAAFLPATKKEGAICPFS